MPSNLKVVSNTPYYISSQIIYNIIRFRKYIKTAILTVQKEVGEKTISSPGSKNYGPISVLNYIYTNSKICYSLSKDVFFPKPEVSSVVLKIKPLEKPKFQISEEKKFNDFLKHIFMLRRKKLINVVNKVFGLEKSEFEKISEANKIETGIRVENLTPEELYKFFLLINPKIK
jgi:16S rRNA (adenine1518-N6/adenine1519-N6)-dimethyltransferase